MRRQRGSIIRPGAERRTGWSVKYRDQLGKQHWEGGFATKGAAQERLNAVLPEVDSGKYITRQQATFKEFAEQWLQGRLRARGSTVSAYASIINRSLVPAFGSMKVSDIRTEHLQAFIAKLASEKANKTVHNAATLLRTMFAAKRGGSAMRLGYIGHDPTANVELPERLKAEIVPPTKEQVFTVIAAAREIGSREHAAAFLGAHCGVRRNELLGLRFSDVDWFAKELRIRRAVSKAKGTDGAHKWEWRLHEPKSNKSKRRIGLTESALAVISAVRRDTLTTN